LLFACPGRSACPPLSSAGGITVHIGVFVDAVVVSWWPVGFLSWYLVSCWYPGSRFLMVSRIGYIQLVSRWYPVGIPLVSHWYRIMVPVGSRWYPQLLVSRWHPVGIPLVFCWYPGGIMLLVSNHGQLSGQILSRTPVVQEGWPRSAHRMDVTCRRTHRPCTARRSPPPCHTVRRPTRGTRPPRTGSCGSARGALG
jgi:hypothetical protein